MNYAFGEAYFEYFESCNFSRENTNIDVSVFMFDLRMINMSSECEYDWYWKKSDCSTKYEVCDSFASLTRQQTKYSGSAGWYFGYQSIHIQITYTYIGGWYWWRCLVVRYLVPVSWRWYFWWHCLVVRYLHSRVNFSHKIEKTYFHYFSLFMTKIHTTVLSGTGDDNPSGDIV